MLVKIDISVRMDCLFLVSIILPFLEAVLITGGGRDATYALESAELFLPWSGSTCSLPSLPKIGRYGGWRLSHTQSGSTLCGGFFHSNRKTCVKWERGDWVKQALTLSQDRYSSSVWTTEQGHYIMGGYGSDMTSENVEENSARPSFSMKYRTM